MDTENQWRRCSACKQPIRFGATYWVCSVSTCNRKRTALAFCSVSCWDIHLPVARHREAWAVEETAPRSSEETVKSKNPAPEKRERKRIIANTSSKEARAQAPTEVLIVASRLKDYIHARSGFNTSDRVLDPLSDIVRRICDQAIQNATRDGRKTVLDRDIPVG